MRSQPRQRRQPITEIDAHRPSKSSVRTGDGQRVSRLGAATLLLSLLVAPGPVAAEPAEQKATAAPVPEPAAQEEGIPSSTLLGAGISLLVVGAVAGGVGAGLLATGQVEGGASATYTGLGLIIGGGTTFLAGVPVTIVGGVMSGGDAEVSRGPAAPRPYERAAVSAPLGRSWRRDPGLTAALHF